MEFARHQLEQDAEIRRILSPLGASAAAERRSSRACPWARRCSSGRPRRPSRELGGDLRQAAEHLRRHDAGIVLPQEGLDGGARRDGAIEERLRGCQRELAQLRVRSSSAIALRTVAAAARCSGETTSLIVRLVLFTTSIAG